MASKFQWIAIEDFRGGRNAVDEPMDLAEDQVVQARNVEFYRTKGFRKRNGSTAPSIGSAFTSVISSLIAHSPNNNPASLELWGIDAAATPVFGRMAGATTFSSVTLKDNLTPNTDASRVRGASYNGKLFLAYNSAVDRMHVWDPNLGSPAVRRMGLATPAAPTAANTGSGSYAATLRYYRVRWRIKNGTAIVAQSEAGASVSFTPSGSGTHARVTQPTVASESETHWVVEGSADDTTFYELAEVAIATTTYDDNETPADYNANTISAASGAYTAPLSWKYLIAAFNRVIGAGTWESGNPQSRVYWTPAKGTADRADDERVPDTTIVRNYADLDEGVGGDITGFAGPIYGAVYIFKYRQIRKMMPTGTASPPFAYIEISTNEGALEQECIAIGENKEGRPTIFFLDSQKGPMSVGPMPPTAIGDKGIRDLWDSVNLAATTKVGQVLDFPARGQVHFWWASGSSNDPDVQAIYDKQTGGWAVNDTGGKIRKARAVALFARTPGTSMSRDLVPYVAVSDENNKILRLNTSDTDDDSTTFQSVVTTRVYSWGTGKKMMIGTPYLQAKTQANVTLTISADLDLGRETITTTVSLTADASETHKQIRVEGLEIGECEHVQFSMGDASAISNAWHVNRLWVPVTVDDVGP